jgi:hypothetical protein
VFLNACTIALDAREHAGRRRQPDGDLARGRHQRERAPRRLQLRPAGRAGQDGDPLLPGRALLRDRRQARRRFRAMSHVTALVADGRPYHEAGAGEAQAGRDAGDAGCLPARPARPQG